MNWPVRIVRLASGPQEEGLWCSPEGLSLTGRPLLQKKENSLQPKALPELQAALDDAYGATPRLDARNYLPGLNGIARSLNKGDLALAMIGSVLLKLPDIPEANTRKYSDEQARDSNGRWTQGAEGDTRQSPPIEVEPKESPSLAPVEAEAAGEAEEGAVPRLAPRVLGLLGDLAGVIAFPVAVAAGVLIPTNRSNIYSGDLPGFPELSYRSDEGMVTISCLDSTGKVQHLYQGFPDADGFYHDDDGHIIGQRVGTGVLFDNEALTDFAVKAGLAPDPAGGDPSKDPPPAASDDQPESCPAPTPENIKGRSKRSLAYQSQITGLPPGLDVNLNGVRFDGCDTATARMIEAKGLGMEWMLNWPKEKLYQSKFYQRMMRQAGRQNNASAGRGDDYYFASKRMADFFSNEFSQKGYSNIKVHYVEALVKKIVNWLRQMITGSNFEKLSYNDRASATGGLGR
jgi:hypothetical protein